jgi:hypothetical protein
MVYTNWLSSQDIVFDSETELFRKIFVTVNEHSIIELETDSRELLRYFNRFNTDTDQNKKPSAKLSFILQSQIRLNRSSGDHYFRRPPEYNFYDALVDINQKHVLFAGIRHYGLLKSIMSGLTSFIRSSEIRQGIHASAFNVGNKGVLLAGGSGVGKTTFFLELLPEITAVTTEDWCDLQLGSGGIRALGIDKNISINTKDLKMLAKTKKVPNHFLSLEEVPHGHRNKVVVPLSEICGEKIQKEVSISHIYLLHPDNIIFDGFPTAIQIYQLLSSISTHQPFCFPTEKLTVDAENKMRYDFCCNLGELVRKKEVTFEVIKIAKDKKSLTENIKKILKDQND